MFGMLLVPNSIMRSLAVGAILVGIVSVIAALTLLPAVLGLLGDKVNALRIPIVGRRSLEQSNPEGRFWGAIVRRVLRRPGLSLALSAGLLLALALPVFRMDIGTSGVSALPDRFASKQGFVALAAQLPGDDDRPGGDRRLATHRAQACRRRRPAARDVSPPIPASARARSGVRRTARSRCSRSRSQGDAVVDGGDRRCARAA